MWGKDIGGRTASAKAQRHEQLFCDRSPSRNILLTVLPLTHWKNRVN